MGWIIVLLIVAMICGTAIWASFQDERVKRHAALLADSQTSMKVQLDHEERMQQLKNDELTLQLRLVEAQKPPLVEAPR